VAQECTSNSGLNTGSLCSICPKFEGNPTVNFSFDSKFESKKKFTSDGCWRKHVEPYDFDRSD